MRRFSKRYWKLVAAVLLTLCLQACSRSFWVKPSGRLGEGVIFHFYDSATATKPAVLSITHFAVQKNGLEGEWELVWGLTGKESLSSIVYGRKYTHLKETMTAVPLVRGAKYRVIAGDTPQLNAAGSAMAFFVVDESGSVVPSEPE
jgi:hypothetical protein